MDMVTLHQEGGKGEGGNVWECTMMTESGDMGTRGGRRRKEERKTTERREDGCICLCLISYKMIEDD